MVQRSIKERNRRPSGAAETKVNVLLQENDGKIILYPLLCLLLASCATAMIQRRGPTARRAAKRTTPTTEGTSTMRPRLLPSCDAPGPSRTRSRDAARIRFFFCILAVPTAFAAPVPTTGVQLTRHSLLFACAAVAHVLVRSGAIQMDHSRNVCKVNLGLNGDHFTA